MFWKDRNSLREGCTKLCMNKEIPPYSTEVVAPFFLMYLLLTVVLLYIICVVFYVLLCPLGKREVVID